MTVNIKLTRTQMEKLQPEINKVIAASQDEKPGMLLAQIKITGEVKAGFINGYYAVKLQKAMGDGVGMKTSA